MDSRAIVAYAVCVTSALKWGIGLTLALALVISAAVGAAVYLYRDAMRDQTLLAEGYAAVQTDDCETALEKFNAALAKRLPKLTRSLALCNRGYCLEKLGRRDEALRDFNEAIKLSPNTSWGFEARAKLHQDKGETDQALADFSEAIRLDPNAIDSLERRAAMYLARQDADRAIADLREAIRARPNHALLYVKLGEAQMRKDDWSAALASFDAAVRIDANYGLAYAKRAEVYELQQEWEKAVSDKARARSLAAHAPMAGTAPSGGSQPLNAAHDIEQGNMALATGQFDRAIEHFNRALATSLPAKIASVIYMDRGSAYLRKNEPENAAKDYDKAIAQDPTNATAYVNRAMFRMGIKQAAPAIADFSAAIALNPEFAEAYMYRGIAKGEAKDTSGAMADLRKAIEMNPPRVEAALNSLAWLRATSRDESLRNGTEAVELATRACELTQWENAGLIDTLAAAYAEKSEFGKATELQAKAFALLPANSEIRGDLEGRLELYRRREPYRED